ncbi:hypothetical protein [Ruegeria sp. B32]|uniref:hypothetical protein n=1 Tax=Ruegeria sp. B32 TaxID=2867020 RepID=UPI0021A347E8|nr:hypothetical protein [Ruegeria sp. B32]UWR09546.1 hypothetical protein K3752_19465 [Ruegeria sp. B32]
MSTFEIAFNFAGAGVTIAGFVYVHHLLRTAGRGRIKDPNLVAELRATAPYYLLKGLIRE